MDITFIGNRITKLRLAKGVSEYQMGLDLKKSGNYIRNITSGKSMPSIKALIDICDYLGLSVKYFFDEGIKNPELMQQAFDILNELAEEDIVALIQLMKRLNR